MRGATGRSAAWPRRWAIARCVSSASESVRCPLRGLHPGNGGISRSGNWNGCTKCWVYRRFRPPLGPLRNARRAFCHHAFRPCAGRRAAAYRLVSSAHALLPAAQKPGRMGAAGGSPFDRRPGFQCLAVAGSASIAKGVVACGALCAGLRPAHAKPPKRRQERSGVIIANCANIFRKGAGKEGFTVNIKN